MTTHWSHADLAALADAALLETPVIGNGSRLIPGVDLWDFWPVLQTDGHVAAIGGGALYMLLSAPATGDPDARHAHARIRLMHRTGGGWADLGPLFPDGFTPGSREWSGSATIDDALTRLTVYFTAAGNRSETTLGFDQRLFAAEAAFGVSGGFPVVGAWTPPVEVVAADGAIYARAMTGGGTTGTIKAFRDPAFFRDPADGRYYLLFTASLARSASAWNGAIGVAARTSAGWRLAAPLIAADGVNNELERPHVVVRDGRYYCFFSTQAKVFAADGPGGPTGLYGMVADAFAGPWRPLNGTGLIAANPAAYPHQAYSWLVLPDLSVLSFVDFPGIADVPADAGAARRAFGGTPAPPFRIVVAGDRARPE